MSKTKIGLMADRRRREQWTQLELARRGRTIVISWGEEEVEIWVKRGRKHVSAKGKSKKTKDPWKEDRGGAEINNWWEGL